MSIPNLRTTAHREGDYYVAHCLDIDISSFATTEAAALTNLQEAIELHLEEASSQPTAAETNSERPIPTFEETCETFARHRPATTHRAAR
jgi:predicted RNase H-like HicB family nuclease